MQPIMWDEALDTYVVLYSPQTAELHMPKKKKTTLTEWETTEETPFYFAFVDKEPTLHRDT